MPISSRTAQIGAHQRDSICVGEPPYPRGTWTCLGQRLADHGFDPFVIDQSVTVEYQSGVSPRRADAQRLRSELETMGGTGGFLGEEDPHPAWREDRSADAYVLSLQNVIESLGGPSTPVLEVSERLPFRWVPAPGGQWLDAD